MVQTVGVPESITSSVRLGGLETICDLLHFRYFFVVARLFIFPRKIKHVLSGWQ